MDNQTSALPLARFSCLSSLRARGVFLLTRKKKKTRKKSRRQTLAAPGACLLFFCRTTKKKDRQVKGEWGKQKKEWLGGALVWLQKKEDRGKGTFSCACVLFYFFLMHSPLCHGTNPKGIALFGFYFLPAHTRKTRIYAQSRLLCAPEEAGGERLASHLRRPRDGTAAARRRIRRDRPGTTHRPGPRRRRQTRPGARPCRARPRADP